MGDLFLFLPDIGIGNYGNNNTPHATNKYLKTAVTDLDQGSDILLKLYRQSSYSKPR